MLRNSAQSAADAAALAAAQNQRDALMNGLAGALADDGDWVRWLTGQAQSPADAQASAENLAADNGASIIGLRATDVRGLPGYEARVRTKSTIGATLVPGTAGKHATARATAVVRPRCHSDPEADPPEGVHFTCSQGEDFDFDPDKFDPADLPDASVLFSVSLAE